MPGGGGGSCHRAILGMLGAVLWLTHCGGERTEVSAEGRGSDKREVIPHRLGNVKPQEFSLMNFIPF